MPQILVLSLEAEIIERLKVHAPSHGRSLEAEVRYILGEEARRPTSGERYARIMELRKQFEGRYFADSTELVREDRNK